MNAYTTLSIESTSAILYPGVTVSAFPRAENTPLVTAHARY